MTKKTNPGLQDLSLPELQEFTAVRRQAVRSGVLAAHGRDAAPLTAEQTQTAVQALQAALARLRGHVERLRPLLSERLDEALGIAARDAEPVKTIFYNHSIALGFSRQQVDWVWDDLRKLEGATGAELLPNGVDDLLAIVDASAADDHILAAGFLRATGEEPLGEAILETAARFSSRGVTPSAYLVLALTLIAAILAAASDSSPESARLLGGGEPVLDENTLADERLAAGNGAE